MSGLQRNSRKCIAADWSCCFLRIQLRELLKHNPSARSLALQWPPRPNLNVLEPSSASSQGRGHHVFYHRKHFRMRRQQTSPGKVERSKVLLALQGGTCQNDGQFLTVICSYLTTASFRWTTISWIWPRGCPSSKIGPATGRSSLTNFGLGDSSSPNHFSLLFSWTSLGKIIDLIWICNSLDQVVVLFHQDHQIEFILQFRRKKSVSINQVDFRFEILKAVDEEKTQFDIEGKVIYGLHLEGARWAEEKSELAEALHRVRSWIHKYAYTYEPKWALRDPASLILKAQANATWNSPFSRIVYRTPHKNFS